MEELELVKFSRFITELRIEDVPTEVLEKIKLCLMDVLECCASAKMDHRLAGAKKVALDYPPGGDACAWGEQKTATPENAAFLNAVRGSLSYRNDLHRGSAIHAGAIVCASAFAAAGQNRASGARTMLGILAGYEGMIRLGLVCAAKGLPRGYRSSAVCASFGAALAAAKTFGLNLEETVSAASFSCNSAAGNNEWASAGTGEDVFQAGWGAKAGYMAALLAASGAIGCAGGLEGDNGLLTCLQARESAYLLAKDLRKTYHLLDVEMKQEEACLMLQAPCQAAKALKAEQELRPERIEKIEIIVAAQARNQPGCDSMTVENSVQAKMNLRYGVARQLAGEQGEWDVPSDLVLSLMKRCEVLENPEYTRAFPRRTPAEIRVVTAEGVYEKRSEDFVPLSEEQVRERFCTSCKEWIGARRTGQLFERIQHMESLESTDEITDLL